ncbi:MAG TPA: asparagine synthase (glutamine-hydrolyzing) [Candidatus Eisenbacteria bacterium]|nr:asparagine synthase (glutamine-hydrolyzing) [Candidatus Eisenbacteria bacterium]
MCGICGAFHYRGGAPDPELLRRQVGALAHRGPDDAGTWIGDGAGLGQARLAILDLSAGGHQPIANEDESLWLTCNGEFYGALAQRRELLDRGHRLRGASDSEIALHLYEERGDAFLAELRGMFAFALFDRRARRLVVARDRLGIKPLYWHDDGERVAFASEARALLLDPRLERRVDERALAAYLALRYVPAPGTIWKDVRKLEPGHMLVCDAGGVRVSRYWELPPEAPAAPAGDERAALRALLEESVGLRLVADVPVGAFLSAGVDSAAVVALMARQAPGRLRTYTVGFAEREVSELDGAREAAAHLGTEHTEVVLDASALAALPRLVWQLDEPYADPSVIPTHFVSERARQDVKVVLTGDGGDEVFAGYRTYPAASRHARLGALPGPLRRFIAGQAERLPEAHRLGVRLRRVGMSVMERHLEAMTCFPERALPAVLAPGLARALDPDGVLAPLRRRHAQLAVGRGEVAALPRLDAETYLADDVLKKVDNASMLHALEVRCPLLDHRLVEHVARLPFALKLRGDVTKWILKQAVADLLPARFFARPKRGFGVPLAAWLRGRAAGFARDVLHDARTRERGWLDPRALAAHADGAADLHAQWTLLCLELWARTYLDRPREALVAPLAV